MKSRTLFFGPASVLRLPSKDTRAFALLVFLATSHLHSVSAVIGVPRSLAVGHLVTCNCSAGTMICWTMQCFIAFMR